MRLSERLKETPSSNGHSAPKPRSAAAPTALADFKANVQKALYARLGAELFDKTTQDFERRSSLGNILADDEHGFIAAHFFGQCFVDRLGQGNFSHVVLLRPAHV